MGNLSKAGLTRILNVMLIIAIALSGLGFVADLNNTLTYGGIDLRNRVVGARLLASGKDPYFFRWQPGDDERFLDPLDKPEIPVSRVTVPPTALLLYRPFEALPYRQQRLIWLGLQWLALLIPLAIMTRVPASVMRSKFLAVNGWLLFAASNFWRVHVERGQIYIFYVLGLAVAYWVAQRKWNQRDICSGLLIGMTASMRFPLIIMTLPMLLFRRFRLLVATWVGFIGSLVGSVLLMGDAVWKSYGSAMQSFAALSANDLSSIRQDVAIVFPDIVEGMDNLTSKVKMPGINSSLQSTVEEILGISLSTSHLIAGLAGVVLLLSLVLLSCSRAVRQQLGLDLIFLSGGVMILIADFFIPAPRYSYNDVQFLIPLLLLLKYLKLSDSRGVLLYLFWLISWLIASSTFIWLPREVALGAYYMMLVTLVMMILIVRGTLLNNLLSNTFDDSLNDQLNDSLNSILSKTGTSFRE
ncbi:MAG: DUF2029 domain-containing protein [Synechococcales cyanobacterium C42_A2020_086]|jgi:hypothetical protein|nr:DUF2029 domain-containing protein [Synechococcales cyanobacterium C42_A2020_086]